MNRKKHIDNIVRLLGFLKNEVELANSINLYDLNIHAEYFYRDLFNFVYDLGLENLNAQTTNAAYIDLIDEKNKKAIQVTSRNDSTKIKEAIEGFFKNPANLDYELKVLLIAREAKNYRADFTFDGKYKFDADKDVIDIKRIINDISDKPTDLIEKVSKFLSKEINLPEQQNKIPKGKPSDTQRFFNSLKDRYKNRYESKLDGRFEITLEVNEDWDIDKLQTYEFDANAKVSNAIDGIRKAFYEKGRLLIVGNPGVGKTVLLLDFAIHLQNKTNPENQPFPVIFNLASWAESYERFEDWLIEMLNSGEGLSKDFAKKLLHEEKILFFLDGLDELARNQENASSIRAKCLESLNEYLDGGKRVVICSRIKEASQIEEKFPVTTKIEILNLSKEKVIDALRIAQDNKEFNEHQTSAKNLLDILEKEENTKLLEVLTTPFYFTTALEIFDKQIIKESKIPTRENEIKNYLISKFIDKKLKKTQSPSKYNKNKTIKWLKWLAKLMEKKQIITFELADLQPSVMSKSNVYGLIGGGFLGLVGGLLVAWFINQLGNNLASLMSYLLTFPVLAIMFGLIHYDSKKKVLLKPLGRFLKLALSIGGGYGIFIFSVMFIFEGIIGGIVFGTIGIFLLSLAILLLLSFDYEIKTEDFINFEVHKLLKWKSLIKILPIGSILGFILGVGNALISNSILIGIFSGMWGGLTGLSFLGYSELKNVRRYTNVENPYQRINASFLVNQILSVLNILFLGTYLIFYKFYISKAIFYKSNLLVFAVFCIFILISLLNTSLFKHIVLRLGLFYEGSTPLKYATFLDYCADARILEKDGGHWRFRHQNLQDYFAKLDEY